MKVKFEALFDEYLPEHAENQGKIFELKGIHNGQVLCTKLEDGNLWLLPAHLVSSAGLNGETK